MTRRKRVLLIVLGVLACILMAALCVACYGVGYVDGSDAERAVCKHDDGEAYHLTVLRRY